MIFSPAFPETLRPLRGRWPAALTALALLLWVAAPLAQEAPAGAGDATGSAAAGEAAPGIAGALARLEDMRAAIDKRAMTAAQGDEQDAAAEFLQRQRERLEVGDLLGRLIAETDIGAPERARLTEHVSAHFGHVRKAAQEIRRRMKTLADTRAALPEEEQVELEYQLQDYDKVLSALLGEWLANARRAEQLGLDTAAELRALDELLLTRADTLSEQITRTHDRLKTARSRLKNASEGQQPPIENEIALLTERHERLSKGLEATVAELRERNQDVSEYVQTLIRTTGEISGDIFDSDVLMGLLDEWLGAVRERIAEDGPGWVFKLFVFLAIIALFRLLANIAANMVRRAVSSSKANFSSLLQNFLVRISFNAVFFLGLLIALSQIGVELGPLLAGLGVAGFIIGFALQDTLSNFASGMMILLYRPFDVGDFVEAGGVSGKVYRMSLVSTTIMTFDNQRLIVPNNKIWGDVIRNVNAEPQRRVDLTFGISYADDIAAAMEILEQAVAEHAMVLEEPAPTIKLHTLGESSVDFIVRPWVETANYWAVYWDLTRTVKERFDAAGITIPFPQRDVHVYAEQMPSLSA